MTRVLGSARSILLASNNQGKLREFKDILQDLDAELFTPQELGLKLNVIEDGETYSENASKKALSFAKSAEMVTLADDSGLEVEALGGAPGLFSARFSPLPNATDADRRHYLLKQLKKKKRPWNAQFRCVVVVATPEEIYHIAEGICKGEIIPDERGDQGFGYDPIFYIENYKLTMAELPMTIKNSISHRGRAVSSARPWLEHLLQLNDEN